jgi:hypothetical protein
MIKLEIGLLKISLFFRKLFQPLQNPPGLEMALRKSPILIQPVGLLLISDIRYNISLIGAMKQTPDGCPQVRKGKKHGLLPDITILRFGLAVRAITSFSRHGPKLFP